MQHDKEHRSLSEATRGLWQKDKHAHFEKAKYEPAEHRAGKAAEAS